MELFSSHITTTITNNNVGIATILGLTVAYINTNSNDNDNDYNNVIEVVSSSLADTATISDITSKINDMMTIMEYDGKKVNGLIR